MSRTMRSLIFAVSLLVCCGAGRSAPKREPASHAVKKQIHGSYSIIQSDNQIGTEQFTSTLYDDNILVLEGTVVTTTTREDSTIEKTSMTLEDDSDFLLSYSSSTRAGQFSVRNDIEMYSNVAYIRAATNGQERTLTRVIPTGALCIQDGIAHQLALLLNRYNDETGGKQGILVFDPVSKADRTDIVELVGPEETVLNGETKTLKLYRVQENPAHVLRLYVDGSRTIVKVVNEMQHKEFILAKENG
jgi:hypothetical protein